MVQFDNLTGIIDSKAALQESTSSIKQTGKKGITVLLKVAMIILLFSCVSAPKASAQSTIYLCYDVQFWTQEIPFKVNGKDAFSMKGQPQKKIYDTYMYTRNKKKCTFNTSGKVILSFDFTSSIPGRDTTIPYSDEIQLNLTPGSEHYIIIKALPKGNSIVFEELSEKDGKKEFANKKYTNNPDYVEPEE